MAADRADAYRRGMTPNPDIASTRRAGNRGRVALDVLTAIGAAGFLGGVLAGAVMGALPGGTEFGFSLIVMFPIMFGALLLVTALILAAVRRRRNWWRPAAALAAGAIVIAIADLGVPRAIMWPLIRADLEQQAGTCPRRAALVYPITSCFEVAGGEAYGLDNGFLNGSALLHLPPGATPPPVPSSGAEGWLTSEDLGDGWYHIVLPWG